MTLAFSGHSSLSPAVKKKAGTIERGLWKTASVVLVGSAVIGGLLLIGKAGDDIDRAAVKASKTNVLFRLLQVGPLDKAPEAQQIITNVQKTCQEIGGDCLQFTYDPKTGVSSSAPTTESLAKSLSATVDQNCPRHTGHEQDPEQCRKALDALYNSLPVEPAMKQAQAIEGLTR